MHTYTVLFFYYFRSTIQAKPCVGSKFWAHRMYFNFWFPIWKHLLGSKIRRYMSGRLILCFLKLPSRDKFKTTWKFWNFGKSLKDVIVNERPNFMVKGIFQNFKKSRNGSRFSKIENFAKFRNLKSFQNSKFLAWARNDRSLGT